MGRVLVILVCCLVALAVAQAIGLLAL